MVIPTIVLHAKDDTVVNYENVEFNHENMAGSQLISFERGGHRMVSQLKAIRQQIYVFLEKQFNG